MHNVELNIVRLVWFGIFAAFFYLAADAPSGEKAPIVASVLQQAD